jgi:hypothetical protein
MAVAGIVRLRKHQFGRQDVLGTKVAATRAYPFSGVPGVDLEWTDSDVDTGSIVTTVPPIRGAGNFGASLTAPQVTYNDAALMVDGIFGGNVNPTGGGAAKTWTHIPAAVAPLDDFSNYTYEFFDDTSADEADQLGDGILTALSFTGPEGLGAITASMTWAFGSAANKTSTDSPVTGTVPTPALDVSTTDAIVYLKDMGIYIASTQAGLGAGQVTDALHTFGLNITAVYDDKRFANGTQSFDVSDRSKTGYTVELAATWAKTGDIIGTGSESDAWFSDSAVNRYVRLAFVSPEIITGVTPYSWAIDMPMRYYTREHGESGGNSTIVLTGRAFYDPDDFDGFFSSVLVNSLTAAELGSAGT